MIILVYGVVFMLKWKPLCLGKQREKTKMTLYLIESEVDDTILLIILLSVFIKAERV